MRALRTIPVLLDIARDMEELCPNALFINYTNPMAMNVWAWYRASKVKVVGLCLSVQGTAWSLAVEDLKIPIEEVNSVWLASTTTCSTSVSRQREDLYPFLRRFIWRGACPPQLRAL